jgi:hypothetical protein
MQPTHALTHEFNRSGVLEYPCRELLKSRLRVHERGIVCVFLRKNACAAQDQGVNPSWVIDSQPLGNLCTESFTDDGRGVDAKRVHGRENVLPDCAPVERLLIIREIS